MSIIKGIPRDIAEAFAQVFLRSIDHYLTKWLIVGDIRRKMDDIYRLDIVVIPKGKNTDRLRSAIQKRDKLIIDKKNYWLLHWCKLPLHIHIANDANFASKTLFKTGPKPYLNKLQKSARSKGYDLSEDGLIKGSKSITFEDEHWLLKSIGEKYIKPENRDSKMEQLI